MGICLLLILFQAQLGTAVPPTEIPGWYFAFEIAKVAFAVIGSIAAIFAIFTFYSLIRGKIYKKIAPIQHLAIIANKVMRNILPDSLSHLEKKGFVPPGTHLDLTRIFYDYAVRAESARNLTDYGNKILSDSNVGKYIDDNIDDLMKKMENKKFDSALDAEDGAFYIIKGEIESGLGIGLKNYFYSHPDVPKDEVILVGSIRLRDLFLDKHKELLPKKKEEKA